METHPKGVIGSIFMNMGSVIDKMSSQRECNYIDIRIKLGYPKQYKVRRRSLRKVHCQPQRDTITAVFGPMARYLTQELCKKKVSMAPRDRKVDIAQGVESSAT